MGELPSLVIRRAPSGALAAPTYIQNRNLAAGTAATVTVPGGADWVVFVRERNSVTFYARWDGGTAQVPGNVTSGTGSEPNPSVRWIDGIGTFSLISEDGGRVAMLFYSDDSESADL
jgi:hypothetical protein